MTCSLCHAHMKQEAVQRHVCANAEVKAQGVAFTRNSEFRYCCSVCSSLVPLSLVRVHALRHDRRLHVEEWHPFTILPRKRGLLHQFVLPDQASAKLAPLPAMAVSLTGGKRQSEVSDFLQKRRKLSQALCASARTYQRVVFVFGKRALRRWIKFAEK